MSKFMFTKSELDVYKNINPKGFRRLAQWLKVPQTVDDVADKIAPINFEAWPPAKYERDW
jgi:hypothetical protein